jgi:hypothetical protein
LVNERLLVFPLAAMIRRRPVDLCRPVALALVAATFAALAPSGQAHAQSCTFRNPAPGNIAFSPGFDPSVASTRTAFTQFRVRCTQQGSPSWTFSGVNGSAPLRMKHVSLDAYIPYSAVAAYVTGGANNQTWRVTATVTGANYADAPIGSYIDSLTATILP